MTKNIVKHTSCFETVALTLASKHQMMIAFHINSPSYGKSCLDVSTVSTVPVDVLKEEVAEAIKLKCPGTSEVHLAKNAASNAMIVTHGSVGGLPQFQLCVINEMLLLTVKVLCGWCTEHYRAFELSLSPSREVQLVALSELTDPYPLAPYTAGSSHRKRQIIIKGWLTTKMVIHSKTEQLITIIYIFSPK